MGPSAVHVGAWRTLTVLVTVLITFTSMLVVGIYDEHDPGARAAPNPIPVLTLSLSPIQQQAVVTPTQNGPVQFSGNATVDFLPIFTCTVTLSASCIWPAIISPSTMEFSESGRPQQFYVTVVVPPATNSREIGTLIVSGSAKAPAMPVATATANAVVTVKQYFCCEVLMDRTSATVGPGDAVEFHCLVTNKGNGLSSFAIGAVDVPAALNVTFPRTSYDLQQSESYNWTVTVRVAADAAPGTYAFVVEVRETEPGAPLAARTETLRIGVGGLSASLSATVRSVSARAGSEVRLYGTVTNHGDLPATFVVRARGSGGGIEVVEGSLTVPSAEVLGPVMLPPGESRDFHFTVRVPDSARGGEHKVRLDLERVLDGSEPVVVDSLDYTVDVKSSLSSYKGELSYALLAAVLVVAIAGLYHMRRYMSRFEPATSVPSYSKVEVVEEPAPAADAERAS